MRSSRPGEWATVRLGRAQGEDVRGGQRLLVRIQGLLRAMGTSNYVEMVDEQLAQLQQIEA